MKTQVRAYMEEAKWFHKQKIPTMDEYMEVALVTSGYAMLATTSFVGMGEIVTKNSFDWLFSNPKIVRASAVVCRLMDDVVSHKVNIHTYIHIPYYPTILLLITCTFN